jgi:hypothetical protein
MASLRRALKARLDGDRTLRELFHFDHPNSTQAHADRAIALICGTILEQSLEIAITTHFRGWKDLSEDDRQIQREHTFGYPSFELAALASFASRIRLGFALGVYGPSMRDDLDCIKNIRNLFAHFWGPASFDHDEIKSACDELMLPRKQVWGGFLGPTPKESRDKFVKTCQWFCLYLMMADEDEPHFYKGSGWELIAS